MDGQAPPAEALLVPPAGLVPRESTDSYAADDFVVARVLSFIAGHARESINVDDVASATPTTRRRPRPISTTSSGCAKFSNASQAGGKTGRRT